MKIYFGYDVSQRTVYKEAPYKFGKGFSFVSTSFVESSSRLVVTWSSLLDNVPYSGQCVTFVIIWRSCLFERRTVAVSCPSAISSSAKGTRKSRNGVSFLCSSLYKIHAFNADIISSLWKTFFHHFHDFLSCSKRLENWSDKSKPPVFRDKMCISGHGTYRS